MHFPFRFPGLIWLSVRILVPASFPNGSVRQKYPLQTRFPLISIIFNMKGHRKRVSGALFLLWDPKHREKRVSQTTFPTIDPLVISNSGSESHKHLIIIPIFIRSVNLSVSTPGPVSVMQISHLCFSCPHFEMLFWRFYVVWKLFFHTRKIQNRRKPWRSSACLSPVLCQLRYAFCNVLRMFSTGFAALSATVSACFPPPLVSVFFRLSVSLLHSSFSASFFPCPTK